MIKGWEGFVGGSRFKSQWGQKIYLSKKKLKIKAISILNFQNIKIKIKKDSYHIKGEKNTKL